MRAFLAETTMVNNSFCVNVKMDKLGEYSVGWHYEREGQNRRFSSKENSVRELLAEYQITLAKFLRVDPPASQILALVCARVKMFRLAALLQPRTFDDPERMIGRHFN